MLAYIFVFCRCRRMFKQTLSEQCILFKHSRLICMSVWQWLGRKYLWKRWHFCWSDFQFVMFFFFSIDFWYFLDHCNCYNIVNMKNTCTCSCTCIKFCYCLSDKERCMLTCVLQMWMSVWITLVKTMECAPILWDLTSVNVRRDGQDLDVE